jgi:protein gp37
MSDNSSIEWTEATWNPVTGCTKVSPGCAHCYAETFAERFRGVPGHPYEKGFDLQLRPERLDLPLTWKRPRKIFVNSMSDLFHENVPDEYIRGVFDTMKRADWHQFQVLTKRPERAAEMAETLPWPEHVWMGTSLENQRWTCRIDELRKTPAAIRFLSCEPLLGPLTLDLTDIHWVIVGGESGPRSRPMKGAWADSIRQQCEAAGVAFFFKQWGAFNCEGKRVGKGKAGRELGGAIWNGLPQVNRLNRRSSMPACGLIGTTSFPTSS